MIHDRDELGYGALCIHNMLSAYTIRDVLKLASILRKLIQKLQRAR